MDTGHDNIWIGSRILRTTSIFYESRRGNNNTAICGEEARDAKRHKED